VIQYIGSKMLISMMEAQHVGEL